MSKEPINEAQGDWSILRNPSPYRIGRAPGAIFNADEQMRQKYLIRKAEEANTFYEKLQLINQMDRCLPQLRDFYQQMINLRSFFVSEKQSLNLTEDQKRAMQTIIDKFDTIGKVIMLKIIPELDKLADLPKDQNDAD